MTTPNFPTRTQKTEDAYIETANTLRDRYLRQRAEEQGKLHIYLGDIDVNPGEIDSKRAESDALVFLCTFTELAKWISEEAKGWRPSTLRIRRAAIRFLFAKEFDEVTANNPDFNRIKDDYDQAIEILGNAKTPRARDVTPRTSAKKQKFINENDLEELGDYIRGTKGKWRTRGFRFLLANIVTGLRPIEWESIQVIDDHEKGTITLIVKNAKATNGRGNGETRTLTINGEHERNIVRDHLYELRTFQEEEPAKTYDDYCKRAYARLYEACKFLWPKRKTVFSLYTGRHQFAANNKASGATKEEIANLMGHVSILTAGRHYGKKRSGWVNKPNTAKAMIKRSKSSTIKP